MEKEHAYNPSKLKMKIHYSAALCFGKNSNSLICQYKSQLSKLLKRSDKSLAAEPHITFNSFLADRRELRRAMSYMSDSCSHVEPFSIRLNRFDVFEYTGVIYLALDDKSSEQVSRIMKSFNSRWILKASKKAATPHITIAKGLSQEELNIAKQLLFPQSVDINLECQQLSLRQRKLDEFQFSIAKNFEFKGLKENLLFY